MNGEWFSVVELSGHPYYVVLFFSNVHPSYLLPLLPTQTISVSENERAADVRLLRCNFYNFLINVTYSVVNIHSMYRPGERLTFHVIN